LLNRKLLPMQGKGDLKEGSYVSKVLMMYRSVIVDRDVEWLVSCKKKHRLRLRNLHLHCNKKPAGNSKQTQLFCAILRLRDLSHNLYWNPEEQFRFSSSPWQSNRRVNALYQQRYHTSLYRYLASSYFTFFST